MYLVSMALQNDGLAVDERVTVARRCNMESIFDECSHFIVSFIIICVLYTSLL